MTRALAAALLLAGLAACSRGAQTRAGAQAPVPAGTPAAAAVNDAATPAGRGRALYREIKDWIVACDNGGTCTLKAVPDESATTLDVTQLGSLTVSREAGPEGKLQVSLDADPSDAVDGAHLALDGKPLPQPRGWSVGELSGGDALSFLRTIKDGRLLRLGAGDKAPLVSLSGLAAVLLAADEAQGRIGSVDALARAGTRPASAAPPAPALPVVTAPAPPPALPDAARFAAAVRATHKAEIEDAGCDSSRAKYDEAFGLSASEAVAVLDCSMAAYQGSALIYRAPRTAPAKARLLLTPPDPPGVSDALKPGDGQLTEGSFDPETLTLATSAKGRGIADCGESYEWTFDGRDFVLTAASRQVRCGGGRPGRLAHPVAQRGQAPLRRRYARWSTEAPASAALAAA